MGVQSEFGYRFTKIGKHSGHGLLKLKGYPKAEEWGGVFDLIGEILLFSI